MLTTTVFVGGESHKSGDRVHHILEGSAKGDTKDFGVKLNPRLKTKKERGRKTCHHAVTFLTEKNAVCRFLATGRTLRRDS